MDYLETYAQLTTGQLLRLAREQGALTDDARRALEVELQRRGISLEQELAREEALFQGEAAELEAERQEKAEIAKELFWDKAEFWAQLLIWEFVAAIFSIAAPLYVGEFSRTVVTHVTENFVLVAFVGAFITSLLPERWTTLKATFLMAAATLLVASVVWMLRR